MRHSQMLRSAYWPNATMDSSANNWFPMPGNKKAGADFGARLRKLREERSLTLVELAKRINLTPAAVWHWENRGNIPRGKTLRAVSAALGVTPDFFETSSMQGDAEEAAPVPSTNAHSLEELMRMIEVKGFNVEISPRRRGKIHSTKVEPSSNE